MIAAFGGFGAGGRRRYASLTLSFLPTRLVSSGVFMLKSIWVICVAVAFCGIAIADEGHHHEELTAAQLGTVHFPVSCSPNVHKSFEKGVALLHSLWYEESGKTFVEGVRLQDSTST